MTTKPTSQERGIFDIWWQKQPPTKETEKTPQSQDTTNPSEPIYKDLEQNLLKDKKLTMKSQSKLQKPIIGSLSAARSAAIAACC